MGLLVGVFVGIDVFTTLFVGVGKFVLSSCRPATAPSASSELSIFSCCCVSTFTLSELSKKPDWATIEGYFQDIDLKIPSDDFRRKISPTPDLQSYEFLYYWYDSLKVNKYSIEPNAFENIAMFLHDDIAIHHKETTLLVDRCVGRQMQTIDFFAASSVTLSER